MTASARSTLARTAIRALRLLREEPRRPGDLSRLLGVSRSTVERILRAAREEGEPVTSRRQGREVWYSLP